MNEEEYEEYCKAVFGAPHEYEHEHDPLQEQLYDESGPVPGCYRTLPAQTE